MVDIQIDKSKRLDGVAIGDALFHQVAFVETDETAVQSAWIDERRIIADFNADFDEPQQLDGFPERARRLMGDVAAAFGGFRVSSVFRSTVNHVRKRLQSDGEAFISIFLFGCCFVSGLFDIFQKTIYTDFEDTIIIKLAMAALAWRRTIAKRRFVLQPLIGFIYFVLRMLRKTKPADERFFRLCFKTHAGQPSFGIIGPLNG